MHFIFSRDNSLTIAHYFSLVPIYGRAIYILAISKYIVQCYAFLFLVKVRHDLCICTDDIIIAVLMTQSISSRIKFHHLYVLIEQSLKT